MHRLLAPRPKIEHKTVRIETMKKLLIASVVSAAALVAGTAGASTVVLTPTQTVNFPMTNTNFVLPASFTKFNPADYGGYALNSVHLWIEATVNATPAVFCVAGGLGGTCDGSVSGILTASLSAGSAPDLVTTIPVSVTNYSVTPAQGLVSYPTVSSTDSASVVYCVINVAGCDVIDAGIVGLFSGIGSIAMTLEGEGVTTTSNHNGFALAGAQMSALATARLAYDYIVPMAPIPVPAALPLLAGALGLLGWAGRRRKAA